MHRQIHVYIYKHLCTYVCICNICSLHSDKKLSPNKKGLCMKKNIYKIIPNIVRIAVQLYKCNSVIHILSYLCVMMKNML